MYYDRRRQDRYNEGLAEGKHISSRLEEAMADANLRTEGAYHAKASGDYGEYSISTIFNALPNEFHIINDIILKTKKGSTQLDHVVVSPYGIYIIETKNHKGMIFGDPNGKVWTQVLNGRGHFTFYNPIWQNQGHIENLSRATGIPMKYMIGIVVFTSPEANLVNARPWCVNPEEAFEMLMSNRNVILSEKGIMNAIDRIDRMNIRGYKTTQQHVEYVKSIKQRDEERRQLRKLRGY